MAALPGFQMYVLENEEPKRTILMNLKYPAIDDTKSPFNEIGSIIAVFLCSLGFLSVTTMDSIFLTVALNIKTHFEILQNKLKNSDMTDHKVNTSEMRNMVDNYIRNFDLRNRNADRIDHHENSLSELRILVQYHIKLLDLTSSLSENFKEIIFTEMIVQSAKLALLLTQVIEPLAHTKSIDFYHFIPHYCFFIGVFIQLCIYCYGGDVITSESFNVNWAIQESSWYNLPPSGKTIILIMMARAQKPEYIKSGFFVASWSTFYTVKLNFIDCDNIFQYFYFRY